MRILVVGAGAIGDLIRRGERTGSSPGAASLLGLAYTRLKADEAREERNRSAV